MVAPPGTAAAFITPVLQQEVTLPDLSFPSPAPVNLEESYKAALQPLSISDFDSSATGAYNRWMLFQIAVDYLLLMYLDFIAGEVGSCTLVKLLAACCEL